MSIVLVQALLSRFMTIRYAFRLLVKTSVGVGCSAPQSSRIFATYLADRAAGVRLVNSASIVLKATKVCFFVFHSTGALATKTMCPPVEWQEGRRSANDALAKVSIRRLSIGMSLPPISMPYAAVPCKYRKRCRIKSR